jgi:DNA-directed RNA polymerase subunit RPC12/RpoP
METKNQDNIANGIGCPKCGSTNIGVQVVSETKKRDCLTVLFMLILLFIPILGWIVLFILLTGQSSKTQKYAICHNCGHSKKIG